MPDRSAFRCPFCGNEARRDKEHVWAQWMRKTSAAQQLLSGSTGRRLERRHTAVRLGESGRYESEEGRMQRVAELLPHVQVDVCRSCNGGWMKQLEDRAKALLAPWSAVGWPVRLRPEDQILLATWATKSWMAYALLSGELKNPFSASEYRSIATSPAPLTRSRVWLLHSDAPTAHVGMGVSSTLFTQDASPPDLSITPDNAGYAYLMYAEWVFFLVLAPQENEVLDLLEADVPSIPTAVRIWPPSEEFVFPTGTADASDLSTLLAIPGDFHRALGLPVIGLTPHEVDEVREAFIAGAEPWQIRAKWAPEELATFERQRLQADPDGYGRTPQPYKVLGGIAWHGGDFQLAVEHYQHARDLGASIAMIGSQLCDALMHAGRYEDAAAISLQVMESGPTEWRDLFREMLLYEIVEELDIKSQARNLDSSDNRRGTSEPTAAEAVSRLQSLDALDAFAWRSWVVNAPAEHQRFSMIYADAYLSSSPASWLVLVSHAASTHSSPIERDSIRKGVAETDGLIDVCLEVLDEMPDSVAMSGTREFLLAARSQV